MMTIPSLFLSHGAPSLVLDDVPARDFLRGLGAQLPSPRAIVVASAHWETMQPMVNAVGHNATIHDFGGFAPELYELSYPAPGSPEMAAQLAALLAAQGVNCAVDDARGLDHGAWVPLMLMYPAHDIPVVQLSIQPASGPEHHLRLGQALAALRARDVLVIGSGSLTHNLRELDWSGVNVEPDWSAGFARWMHEALVAGRVADLLAYRRLAPQARRNHPTDEHLLPLFVAMGAGLKDGMPPALAATRLHTSHTFGSLRMDAYAFA